MELHEVILDLIIHDTTQVSPVNPVIEIEYLGKTSTVEIHDENVTYPFSTIAYGEQRIGRAKHHVTGTWGEMEINSNGDYEPFTIRSITLGWTPAGEYQEQ